MENTIDYKAKTAIIPRPIIIDSWRNLYDRNYTFKINLDGNFYLMEVPVDLIPENEEHLKIVINSFLDKFPHISRNINITEIFPIKINLDK